jgi:vitamin B12 transporter
MESGKDVATTTTDAAGKFHFKIDHTGRYSARAAAKTFATSSSAEVFAEPGHTTDISLTLSPSVVSQNIVVTATGIPTPEAQMGTTISVIDSTTLGTKINLDQALRNETGSQVVQTGQMGGLTALYVRGGPSDANKVLLDGIPINDIGGNVDLSYLQADGFERVEFQRGPNSALYGSDAMASVVSITTARGDTPLPLFTIGADGGTFGTYHEDGSVGGYWKRFDYFGGYSGFGTQNDVPDSQYHRDVYLANFGYQIDPNTTLRATVRRLSAGFNTSNAVDAYGIPDDASTDEGDTDFGATLEHRGFGDRWHTLLQYGGLRMRQQYNDWAPTGIPFDPYDLGYPSYYLGLPLTQRGANGYAITPAAIAAIQPTLPFPGQAIYQYAGNYPELSSYLTNTNTIYAQTDYRFNEKLTALFGFRYSNETGDIFEPGVGLDNTDRNNFSYMLEIQGGLWGRLFYTLGGGIEDNAVFGVAETPRVSLAYYLVRPGGSKVFSGTRLTVNFAKGVKEPSIYYQDNSLYGLLSNTSLVPNGPQLIQQYHIRPFLAEDSRTYDGGVQQQLFGGKATLSAILFHNEFTNQAEYVDGSVLAQLGVPAEVAQALSYFGAALNTLNYRAQGAEVGFTYKVNHAVNLRGGWTYTDAVVQQSFANALGPAINPLFPTIPIGAYSPLVGARPFRIAPNTGYVGVEWNGRRWFVAATGTFVSRRDDSTFLSDTEFGNTLLLPNRNLDPAYQKIDLYGSYNLTKHLTAYTSLQNLLNQSYQEVYGYPALPFTIRGGMKFTFGGESWKLN